MGLNHGGACVGCRGLEACRDKPSAAEPLVLECPTCSGSEAGCRHCDGGRVLIDRCPLEIVTPDVWHLLKHAARFAKGLPPIHGGTLDQSAQFLDACDLIWRLEHWWKRRIGIKES